MCLLVFGYDVHSRYSLVFAGNRDEFYERPTAPAGVWDDAPHIIGGRDLKAGGAWMGVTRAGHWGVVTNVREPGAYRDDARSRGALVADYLREEPDPRAYLEAVAAEGDRYNGFNLLLGTPTTLYHYTNRETGVHAVAPGIHGLSNARLNTPWPKVTRAQHALQAAFQQQNVSDEVLFDLLDDRRPAPDAALPDTGLGRERERMLSPLFIEGERYGTRASTVLRIGREGTVSFAERTFEQGDPTATRHFTFEVEPAAA